MKWVDEHPDRYAPIMPYDHVGMTIPGRGVHFVAVDLLPKRIFPRKDHTDCGIPIDLEDVKVDRENYWIGGVVECPDCLAAMKIRP